MRIALGLIVVSLASLARADLAPEPVPAPVPSQAAKTVVKDAQAKAALLGSHLLSLQWISWEEHGQATVREEQGALVLKGEQRKGEDFLTVEGTITLVEARSFELDGTVVTRVSHINQGKPCTRSGKLTFAQTGKRKYWRLKQMDNPCEGVTDYVDLYLRRAPAAKSGSTSQQPPKR